MEMILEDISTFVSGEYCCDCRLSRLNSSCSDYLISSLFKSGIWSTLQDATKERPWLWAIYVIVVLLPIILIIACCLPGKKVTNVCLPNSMLFTKLEISYRIVQQVSLESGL